MVLLNYPAKLREIFSDPSELGLAFSTLALSGRRKALGIRTLKQCVTAPYPTLRDVALTYETDKTAELLIGTYVVSLNETCNVSRMDEDQVTELNELIFTEASYLKLTEMHEFFRRVKTAYYGGLFGSLDCVKVMTALRLFLKDRQDAMRSVEAEQRREKSREVWDNRDCVPMPESLKRMCNI